MKKHLLLAAAAVATFATAPVFAQSFTGGAAAFTNVGDDGRNSGFDALTFSPLAGTYTGPGAYALNTVSLTVGVNRDTPIALSGVFTGLQGTFGGQAFTYNVNYTGTIANDDTFRIGGNTIDVFGTPVFLNPFTVTTGVGGTTTGTLLAVVGGNGSAVPEPATWAMMMLGFGMIGFGLRRRAKQTVRVTYA